MLQSVAYCRVSKDSKDQRNSLNNQIGHYTQLFEKDGYQGAACGVYYSKERRTETITPLKSIFADEGISCIEIEKWILTHMETASPVWGGRKSQ
jgi:hypothetical protein